MSNNQLIGAAGEALVSFLVHHELGWVLRDQPAHDVGVDGQIEVVDDGKATGLLLAAQVKAGANVFKEPVCDGWVYRPTNPDNVDYWLRYPMPVLLVLADNPGRRAYWQLVSKTTLTSTGVGWKIMVPRVNELNADAKGILVALAAQRHTDLARELVERLRDVHGDTSPAAAESLWSSHRAELPADMMPMRFAAADLLAEQGLDRLCASAEVDGDGVRALLRLLVDAGLGHVEVLVGYRLPHSSTRVDLVLCGTGFGSADAVYVMVVLKPWMAARPLFGELVLADDSTVPALHPAEQVRRYRDYVVDGGSGLAPESVHSLAYLHNARMVSTAGLQREKTDDGSRLYTSDTASELARHLHTVFDSSPSAGVGQAAARLLSLRRAAPKSFLDMAVEEIQGGERVVLMDEQQVVFALVADAVERAAVKPTGTVVVVLGGPGSGKSTIAMSLFGTLARRGLSVYHATGSSSFTSTLRKHVGRRNPRVQAMFKYFNSFIDAEPASLDVLICDEAHRLRETSVNRYTKRAFPSRPQAEELITAARVVVLFLDENQTVRLGEIGSLVSITAAANRLGRNVEVVRLGARFRSERLDTWVSNLLQVGTRAEPTSWSDLATRSGGDCVVRSTGSPREMESWLLSRQHEQGGTARIAAGYCWPWNDPVVENGTAALVPDVRIGDWYRPWNAKPEKRVPDAPAAHFWASDDRGFGQVGSIYTAQGFEYDWAGVIFGNDFVRRDDRWVARREYSYDPAVKRADEELFARLIHNTYKVLLTRGTRGVCVFSVDEETQEFLRSMTS